jgi:ABC-type polysaccharide/polyol phosphate transport system ATPase subunit
MESVIKLENVTKVFKIPHLKTQSLKSYILHLKKSSRHDLLYALTGVSIDIKKGEFISVIGRNGSGKSTLLKIIAGILVPTEGRVYVAHDVSPFLELGVGFNLELTAKENIMLYSSILGIPKQKAIKNIPEILSFAELEDFIDSPLKTFSSGMQVRLAFSVAIQADAPIILVDEVLAVGDIKFQQKCFSVFDDLKKQRKTIVYVSHQLDTVEKYSDRVYYLKRGEHLIDGSPREMIELYTQDNK